MLIIDYLKGIFLLFSNVFLYCLLVFSFVLLGSLVFLLFIINVIGKFFGVGLIIDFMKVILKIIMIMIIFSKFF